MNKLTVLAVVSLVAKLLIFGAISTATFFVSHVLGALTLGGYFIYLVAGLLIEREVQREEAVAMNQFMSQFEKKLGGGSC